MIRVWAPRGKLLAASGCDFLYGVNRHTRLPSAPDFQCVEQVIRRAPGVDEVKYRRTEGSRPLTIEYDGRTDFSQHLRDLNRKPPQTLIDASRPVMHWIEEQLEVECDMSGLTNSIAEWCKGVECPLLSSGEPDKPLQPTRATQPNKQREPAGSGPRG